MAYFFLLNGRAISHLVSQVLSFQPLAPLNQPYEWHLLFPYGWAPSDG